MKGFIYKYTFPDGKVYIGQTKNLEKRKREHIDPKVGPVNTGFWEAYQKYGKFEFEVIREIENEDIDVLTRYLNYYESGYIYQYKSSDPRYGYNRTSMGTVSTGVKKILEQKRLEIYYNILEVLLPVFNSASYKIWKTKEPLTEEEKYFVTERYKALIPNFSNLRDYNFDDLSKNKNDVSTEFWIEELLGKVRQSIEVEANERAWLLVQNHAAEILKEERDKHAIVQLDKDGNVIKEYYSVDEICQDFNIVRADNVRNVLRGKQKTAYGYYWKYKRDMK